MGTNVVIINTHPSHGFINTLLLQGWQIFVQVIKSCIIPLYCETCLYRIIILHLNVLLLTQWTLTCLSAEKAKQSIRVDGFILQ